MAAYRGGLSSGGYGTTPRRLSWSSSSIGDPSATSGLACAGSFTDKIDDQTTMHEIRTEVEEVMQRYLKAGGLLDSADRHILAYCFLKVVVRDWVTAEVREEVKCQFIDKQRHLNKKKAVCRHVSCRRKKYFQAMSDAKRCYEAREADLPRLLACARLFLEVPPEELLEEEVDPSTLPQKRASKLVRFRTRCSVVGSDAEGSCD
eukprot:gnl/TRDRNA2_/TRDRNA2_164156_c0_seq5.p1 gnl/TRDRNA2_/TRDRNA2_164156_c0~~gnl/TRDRNA2_/TRDRNA2_164156_c0_seq5.p1  ORF type:complete len:204 (-),score=23.75 gnl/TRDRNA2_/TRDRNA2_164156_c0_seq5:1207-1818(-)